MFSLKSGALAGLILTGFTVAANAATVDVLGDKDFSDGQTPIMAADFEAASGGDPAGFNELMASDIGQWVWDGEEWVLEPSFGTVSYTHHYDLLGTEDHARVVIGLYDHDSFELGQETIAIYFDGVAQDVSMWEGISSSQSSFHARSMSVDLAFFDDGALNIDIVAIASGGGDPINGMVWHIGNGIGVDYSVLLIDAPLPGAGMLMLAGLGAFGAYRRKR